MFGFCKEQVNGPLREVGANWSIHTHPQPQDQETIVRIQECHSTSNFVFLMQCPSKIDLEKRLSKPKGRQRIFHYFRVDRKHLANIVAVNLKGLKKFFIFYLPDEWSSTSAAQAT